MFTVYDDALGMQRLIKNVVVCVKSTIAHSR